jgi:hypothetical protein
VTRHLFIVSRREPDLFSYLAREFSAEPEVTVILDRRHGERRTDGAHGAAQENRRQAERRLRTGLANDLSTLGYAFVRLGC